MWETVPLLVVLKGTGFLSVVVLFSMSQTRALRGHLKTSMLRSEMEVGTITSPASWEA